MTMIPCPPHDALMTPTAARTLALDLALLADAAEGHRGLTGFVTRVEVLMELETLRREVVALRERVGLLD